MLTTYASPMRLDFSPKVRNVINWLGSPAGLITLVVATLTSALLLTGFANAQTTTTNDATVWGAMFYKAQDFFYNIRYLTLLIGAIIVIGLMISAFSGKFPVVKAVVFSFAIIVIASAGMIVSYFAGGSVTTSGGAIAATSSGIGTAQTTTGVISDTEGGGTD